MELTEEQQEQLASYTADFLDSGSDESLRSIISLFDNDADGKLTTDELMAIVRVQSRIKGWINRRKFKV